MNSRVGTIHLVLCSLHCYPVLFSLKKSDHSEKKVSFIIFIIMNGYHNLVLPFSVSFPEVEENKEAVLNGLSAIQRFFDGNIWSPLGANIETLFVSGVVGATDDLCDWFEVPASWPAFEPEKWEEKEHLWYVFFVLLEDSGFFFIFFISIIVIIFFVCCFLFLLKKKATGRFPSLSRNFFCNAFQDSLVA